MATATRTRLSVPEIQGGIRPYLLTVRQFEKMITAQDRDTLKTAAHALDRVLLWRWYLVPNWDSRTFHIAYWDRFGHPDIPIRDGFNFDTWWVDAAKAAAIDAAKGQ